MGINEIMSYYEVDDALWEKYFRTNFLAANDVTKFYLSSMLSREYGRIIFIASEEAVMTSGQMPQYGVTISMPGNVNFIKTQRGCRGIDRATSLNNWTA